MCEDLNFSFSPATIRNEMAGLVSLGYLYQPHISSGRVPSCQGYRMYINKLMEKKPLPVEERNLINGILSTSSTDPESLFKSTVSVLSDITGLACVITAPPDGKSKVRDIKFVQVSRHSAMIVIITSSGMIKNKLFRCEYDLNSDILHMFSEILNQKFRGKSLDVITPEFMNFLVDGNKELSFLLMPVIGVLIKASEEACEVAIKIKGQKNLLSIPDIDPETVIDIFNFIENKEKLLDVLNLTEYGIKFSIGEENIYTELQNASVASTRYSIGDKSGVIAVIGPTRMNYSKIASQLQYISALVGVLLERMLEK